MPIAAIRRPLNFAITRSLARATKRMKSPSPLSEMTKASTTTTATARLPEAELIPNWPSGSWPEMSKNQGSRGPLIIVFRGARVDHYDGNFELIVAESSHFSDFGTNRLTAGVRPGAQPTMRAA